MEFSTVTSPLTMCCVADRQKQCVGGISLMMLSLKFQRLSNEVSGQVILLVFLIFVDRQHSRLLQPPSVMVETRTR